MMTAITTMQMTGDAEDLLLQDYDPALFDAAIHVWTCWRLTITIGADGVSLYRDDGMKYEVMTRLRGDGTDIAT